jgi:3-methyl-2-oxobutanoate hydroxymethyltransferase
VQGRGEAAEQLMADAQAVQEAGAFAVVLELVPAELANSVTKQLSIPTIGIGAGNGTDGQILVWTDFAGMSAGKPRKFVRQYLNIREQLLDASKKYVEDVASGHFPNESESFED